MLHYDRTSGIVSYFRPVLEGVVNKVFNRKFEKFNLLQGLFSIAVERLGTWSFSFLVLAVAYSTMLVGGYCLGNYVPVDLLLLVLIPFILLMRYGVFLSATAHAVALGIVVSLVSVNPVLVYIAIGIFALARLFIDVPNMKLMLQFSAMHETVGAVYLLGWTSPMENVEGLVESIQTLQKLGVADARIIKAYALGYYFSDDEQYKPNEIMEFIADVLRESINDSNIG